MSREGTNQWGTDSGKDVKTRKLEAQLFGLLAKYYFSQTHHNECSHLPTQKLLKTKRKHLQR